jgi:transposase
MARREELTDEQWAIIAPLIPEPPHRACFAIAAFSSGVNVRSLIAIGSLLNRRGFYKRLAGCAT